MKKLAIWIAVVVALGAVLAVSVVYTERPQFCPTCHEMAPYYDAWAQGPHNDTSCMDCHVERGVVNHFLHKFVALKEVWDHFTTSPAYPAYTAQVPDHRCTYCHDSVADPSPALPGFAHAEHASAAECQGCHQSAGHAVTFGELADAGILAPAYKSASPTDATGKLTLADPKPGAPAGHADVVCARCHAMATAGCDYCHEKPAKHVDTKGRKCAECHKPGDTFKGAKFTHTGTLVCSDCHQPPANHFVGATCSSCHKPSVPFAKTVFRHPGNTGEHSYKSFPCVNCHPNGFGSASCTKCHKGGAPRGD